MSRPRDKPRTNAGSLNRHTAPIAVLVACGVMLLAALHVVLASPRMANHFGYALGDALPYRVSYVGRGYWNSRTCAGASWCPNTIRCTGPSELGPNPQLHRVGWMLAYLGPPRAILLDHDPGATLAPPRVLVAYRPGCYVSYSLMGGP